MSKKYIIFAGCNGVGKSTLFQTCTCLHELPRVNMDEIVKSFGSWKNNANVISAGKKAVRLVNHYLDSGISFTQETTLCGHSIISNIEKAYALGYEIIIYFVFVESADIAIKRIHERVKNGGHGINDADVIRRFKESKNNLKKISKYCTEVQLFNNTEKMVWVKALK